MAKIDPVEDAYLVMRERTRGTYPVPDRRGPLVYELSEDPSLNGVNPDIDNEGDEWEETEKEPD